jgi:thiol peroxidase
MNTMTRLLIVLCSCIIAIGLNGCASLSQEIDSVFSYSSIPIAQGSATTGEGSSIQFKGSALALSGQGIATGDSLRSVNVAKGDLSLLDIASTKGTVRIISVVPSLDTKVCEQQTHYLSEKNNGLDAQVDLYTISVDTPFAQDRFAKEAKINNVIFLSDYRGGDFGRTFGLLLEGVCTTNSSVPNLSEHAPHGGDGQVSATDYKRSYSRNHAPHR